VPNRDPRIDAYIAAAGVFARPILRRLRGLVHRACPDVEETLKWRMPTFMYHGILCGMAAFKQHVSFGFWKHALVMGTGTARDGMGSFGKVAKLEELPPDRTVVAAIRRAMRLNETGAKKSRSTERRPALKMPDDLSAALRKNKRALAAFAQFSPTNQRDYIEWITGAKREETRRKRLGQAIEWIAAGKPRNWKYMNC
jgi:uncharacterized protein YdeI (YjbR/CyaY-like superfamily)